MMFTLGANLSITFQIGSVKHSIALNALTPQPLGNTRLLSPSVFRTPAGMILSIQLILAPCTSRCAVYVVDGFSWKLPNLRRFGCLRSMNVPQKWHIVRTATAEIVRYEINQCTTDHNRISASRDCRCSVCIFNTETNGNRQTRMLPYGG